MVPKLVKIFPALYGTRQSIAVLTTPRHISLSRERLVLSAPSQPIYLRSALILSFHLHLDLPNCLFNSLFPSNTCMCLSSSPYVPHFLPISLLLFDHLGNVYIHTRIHRHISNCGMFNVTIP